MTSVDSQAKRYFDAGQLASAITQAGQDVKANPADSRARTFLFELLCFAGEYERATRQLEVLGHQSVSAEGGVQVFRNVLAAEHARRRLWSDGVRPTFLTLEPAYTHLHLDAVNRLRENDPAAAVALLEAAAEQHAQLTGTFNGEPFTDFRDCDEAIGPFLEAIVQNQYVWLPFEQIRLIEIHPPKRLRDLLWASATVKGWEQPFGEVFLPVLYAGSYEQSEDAVKLGRMTEWKAAGASGPVLGAGQRTFLVDGQERAILEAREILFEKTSAETGSERP